MYFTQPGSAAAKTRAAHLLVSPDCRTLGAVGMVPDVVIHGSDFEEGLRVVRARGSSLDKHVGARV